MPAHAPHELWGQGVAALMAFKVAQLFDQVVLLLGCEFGEFGGLGVAILAVAIGTNLLGHGGATDVGVAHVSRAFEVAASAEREHKSCKCSPGAEGVFHKRYGLHVQKADHA